MSKLEYQKLEKIIGDKLKAIHKRTDEILVQVKVTNGRVDSLEAWKDKVTGVIIALTTVGTIIGFFFAKGWVGFIE